MIYVTYNIYEDAFQAKHRPLNPNANENVAFFTHPDAFTPYTQYPIKFSILYRSLTLKKRYRRFFVVYYTKEKYKIRAKVVVFLLILTKFQMIVQN